MELVWFFSLLFCFICFLNYFRITKKLDNENLTEESKNVFSIIMTLYFLFWLLFLIIWLAIILS